MRLYFSFFISLLVVTVYGQNLVPNPSFEEYLECPLSTGELDQQVENWDSWAGTPDFYHVCNNEGLTTAGVPSNALGFQNPLLGSGYAGFITYYNVSENYREYIAGELALPLIIGQTYYVVYHVSLYDGGSKDFFNCASNHLGLRFFENPNFNNSNNPLEPDNFAHVDYSEILVNDTEWTKVEATFTADANYNWVALGNFFDDDNTSIQELNPNNECWAIYYVENICIASNEQDCEGLLSSNSGSDESGFHIFPNPADDQIILTHKDPILAYQIFDMTGKLLLEQNHVQMPTVQIPLSRLASGMYLLKVSSERNQLTTKFLKR